MKRNPKPPKPSRVSNTWLEFNLSYPGASDFANYEMRREGKKQYGFYYANSQAGSGAIVRFNCSYPKAQRRFKLLLITHRLLS